ncbi:MAG: hypothetical protein LC733_03960, partial [Actinobacteria bacterium]|nr:hypothetical protein [Actinomycetota bacterium]
REVSVAGWGTLRSRVASLLREKPTRLPARAGPTPHLQVKSVQISAITSWWRIIVVTRCIRSETISS